MVGHVNHVEAQTLCAARGLLPGGPGVLGPQPDAEPEVFRHGPRCYSEPVNETVTSSATFMAPMNIEYGLTPNSDWRT